MSHRCGGTFSSTNHSYFISWDWWPSRKFGFFPKNFTIQNIFLSRKQRRFLPTSLFFNNFWNELDEKDQRWTIFVLSIVSRRIALMDEEFQGNKHTRSFLKMSTFLPSLLPRFYAPILLFTLLYFDRSVFSLFSPNSSRRPNGKERKIKQDLFNLNFSSGTVHFRIPIQLKEKRKTKRTHESPVNGWCEISLQLTRFYKMYF